MSTRCKIRFVTLHGGPLHGRRVPQTQRADWPFPAALTLPAEGAWWAYEQRQPGHYYFLQGCLDGVHAVELVGGPLCGRVRIARREHEVLSGLFDGFAYARMADGRYWAVDCLKSRGAARG